MKTRVVPAILAMLALVVPATAVAQKKAAPPAPPKWTVSCAGATLAARDKGAKVPYEAIEVKRFVIKVDVGAKSCSVDSVEATFVQGKAAPVALADPDAKCILNVTSKGRVFLDGRALLKGNKVPSTPIVTVNYEVREEPPAAGSPEAAGRYFIVSGFPTTRPKDATVEKEAKAACTQAK